MSMLVVLLVTYILFLLAVYVLLVRAFKGSRFYRQVLAMKQLLAKAPVDIKSKRDIRKYRKIRPYIKPLRKKLLVITLVHSALFLMVYASSLLMALFLSGIFETFYVESPIGIPLLSAFNPESGHFVIPVYVIVILALTGSLYVFMREARVE